MRICMKHLFQRCHWTPFDTSLVLNPKMAVVRNSCNRMVSMMSETKHMGPGSECPPLKPGTLRLYSMKFCPYAERTRLVLAAKDVPHEVVNVNLKQKPDWFLAKYETAKVPALELDDKLVPESLVTCDLLEELHPEPALYPADPWQRARDRYFIELFNGCIIVLHRMYRYAGDVEKTKELGESFDSKIQERLLLCKKYVVIWAKKFRIQFIFRSYAVRAGADAARHALLPRWPAGFAGPDDLALDGAAGVVRTSERRRGRRPAADRHRTAGGVDGTDEGAS